MNSSEFPINWSWLLCPVHCCGAILLVVETETLILPMITDEIGAPQSNELSGIMFSESGGFEP